MILTWIISNTKTIALATVIALLAYSCAITNRYVSERGKRKDAEAGMDAAIDLGKKKTFEITKYKNKEGIYTSLIKALQVSERNFKELRDSEKLYWVSQFKGVKKDNSNVLSATKIGLVFEPKEIPLRYVKIKCDSVKAFKWSFKDVYNDISAIVLDTPRFFVRLPIHEVVTFGRRSKRFLFFRYGPREVNTEVSTPNTLFDIDTVITVVRKR